MGSNLFPIILSKHLRWKMFGSIRGGGERGIGRKLVRGGLNRSFKGRNVSKGRGISVNGRWSRREEEEGSSEKRGSSPVLGQFYCTFGGFLRGGRPGVSQRETRKVTLNRFLLSFRWITFPSPMDACHLFFPPPSLLLLSWKRASLFSRGSRISLFFMNRGFRSGVARGWRIKSREENCGGLGSYCDV